MSVLRSIAIAFSMFSRIPVRQVEWNERNMRYVMAAFPLVGAVIGIVQYGWYLLCAAAGIGAFLQGAGCFFISAAVTGGIHLDGLCDVCDALGSHSGREEKLRIMKDPHIGAFGVIGFVLYSIMYAALASELPPDKNTAICFALTFVVSRCLSGLAMAVFPVAKDSGLAHTFSGAAARRVCTAVLVLGLAVSAACMVVLNTWLGLAVIAAAAVTFLCYYRLSVKGFGGITGDLAGWFLQLCELCTLAAIIAVCKIMFLV